MAGTISMNRRVALIGAAGVTGTLLARGAAAAVPEIDTGRVQGGRVEFPAWTAPTERPYSGPPNPAGKRAGRLRRRRPGTPGA